MARYSWNKGAAFIIKLRKRTLRTYFLQQCLYFFPLPQGQGLLRPTFSALGWNVSSMVIIIISSMFGSAGKFIADISLGV